MGLNKLIGLGVTLDAPSHVSHPEISDGASPVCRDPGNERPEMPEEIHAMLIISGCTAQWQGTYWRVANKKTGKFTHLGRTSPFEEWRVLLNAIGQDQTFGQ